MYSTVQYCKLTLTLWVGERRVAAGGWRRADGGRQAAGGRRQAGDGRRGTADVAFVNR